jgi:hypothetical protein
MWFWGDLTLPGCGWIGEFTRMNLPFKLSTSFFRNLAAPKPR